MIFPQAPFGSDLLGIAAAGCLLLVLLGLALLWLLVALFAVGCLALAVLVALVIAALMGAFDAPPIRERSPIDLR